MALRMKEFNSGASAYIYETYIATEGQQTFSIKTPYEITDSKIEVYLDGALLTNKAVDDNGVPYTEYDYEIFVDQRIYIRYPLLAGQLLVIKTPTLASTTDKHIFNVSNENNITCPHNLNSTVLHITVWSGTTELKDYTAQIIDNNSVRITYITPFTGYIVIS
jgi:hypothetical protein